MGVVMEPIDEFLDAFVDDRVVGDVVYPRVELRRGGQLAVEQQVRRFQERAARGQLLDRIAAVAQDPLVAVDVTDRTAARRGVQEPGVVRRQPRIVVRDLDLAQVDRSDRAVLDRQLVRLAGPVVGDGQGALRHANRPGKWLAKDNREAAQGGKGGYLGTSWPKPPRSPPACTRRAQPPAPCWASSWPGAATSGACCSASPPRVSRSRPTPPRPWGPSSTCWSRPSSSWGRTWRRSAPSPSRPHRKWTPISSRAGRSWTSWRAPSMSRAPA